MDAPNQPKKRRGRKPATGRYDSRYLLCRMVWTYYTQTPMKMAQIARVVRVSEGTVARIINTKEGYTP